MSNMENGGHAFPNITPDMNVDGGPGMSLRDWFAGQALQGILAGGFADTIPHDDVNGGGDAAYFAYQYADAMLKIRKGLDALRALDLRQH